METKITKEMVDKYMDFAIKTLKEISSTQEKNSPEASAQE